MQKRGQASMFVIIGIVSLAAIILVFFLFRSVEEKARGVTDTEQYLKSQINDINREVVECIEDASNNVLDRLYDKGGHLNPVRYTSYNNKQITVLCYKVYEDRPCYNMMFTKAEIVEQIIPELERDIPECVENKLDAFRNKDYSVDAFEFSLNKDELVFDENILLISINYPITLVKDNKDEIQERFIVSINTNFWELAALADNIVNTHARGESVDIPELSSSNIYSEIGRTSYSQGNIYMVKQRSDDRVLYFAVET